MNDRLPTGLLVSALIRRVNDAGGFAVVRARGDAQAGGVLILVLVAGLYRIMERGLGPSGENALIESRSGEAGEAADDYWHRRRQSDPDLWVIELDSADAERFVAETILQT